MCQPDKHVIDRLRNRREMINRGNGDVIDVPDECCEEAATEIERLRAALTSPAPAPAPSEDDPKAHWQAWAKKRLDIQAKHWLRAAKAALNGDMRELRNRIEMAEAPPVDVVLSEAAEPMQELHELPAPAPDVAGVVDYLRKRVDDFEKQPERLDQFYDGDDARIDSEAATLLTTLSAALEPFKEAAETHAQCQKDHKFLARERESMWGCLGIELADLDRARTALTAPSERPANPITKDSVK